MPSLSVKETPDAKPYPPAHVLLHGSHLNLVVQARHAQGPFDFVLNVQIFELNVKWSNWLSQFPAVM